MTKTFQANFPAVTNKLTGRTFSAETVTFTQMENGNWMSSDFGSMFVTEVEERCRKATNWNEIKTALFPMADFRDGDLHDNTPSHKTDY